VRRNSRGLWLDRNKAVGKLPHRLEACATSLSVFAVFVLHSVDILFSCEDSCPPVPRGGGQHPFRDLCDLLFDFFDVLVPKSDDVEDFAQKAAKITKKRNLLESFGGCRL
jgi:hypothetical protein